MLVNAKTLTDFSGVFQGQNPTLQLSIQSGVRLIDMLYRFLTIEISLSLNTYRQANINVKSRRFGIIMTPSPCFIPSPYFPVRVLYLAHILYAVRSP